MGKRITYTGLLLLLLSAGGYSISPGTGFRGFPSIRELPESYNENYLLLTDRSLYAAGEDILFSVFNRSPLPIKNACWSKVIYIHILKGDGSSVAEGKYPLDCRGTSSSIAIPGDLLTGHYTLCAYTRWMRNFGPEHYAYVPIKIFNPFSSRLEEPGTTDGSPAPESQTREQTPGSAELPVYELECLTDKTLYSAGENIRLSIHYAGVFGASGGEISISIARPGALDTMHHQGIYSEFEFPQGNPEQDFLPELRGLTISGKVIAGDPPQPVEHAQVELSVFGNEPRFMTYKSGKDGTFVFALDAFRGEKEMFITARHSNRPQLEIFIDNDYSSHNGSLAGKPFLLNNSEREAAREMMLNLQMEKYFVPEIPDTSSEIPALTRMPVFHGLVDRKLWIDEYIELPNLKEVFIELIPEVMPRTRNKVSYLRFTGDEMIRELMGQFEPLVLLDQIPVYDIDKLLSLSPEKIRSIEVINNLYIIGNTSYGGLMNIVSKNGDMGGIDLPEPSFFFSFEGLWEDPPGLSREMQVKGFPGFAADSVQPEFRNTLYWEPALAIEPEQEISIVLPASQKTGPFRVIVRGVTPDGSLLYGKCNFRIE
jgi:hypothetical protein